MKIAKTALCVSLVLSLSVAAANAGAPLLGTYTSSGGEILQGRYSESWIGGGPLLPGNAHHAQSWDGAVLATEWEYLCPFHASVVFVNDKRDGNGNGQIDYLIVYTGAATLTLAGTGKPWDGGDATYTGDITSYTETRTEQYVAFVLQGANSNISMDGNFVGTRYPCFSWQANGVWVGNTNVAALPAMYPGFVDSGCAAGPTTGSWSDQVDITLDIFQPCSVPIKESTWGGVKAIYRSEE